MKMIITEEKSSGMMEKLHKMETFVEDMIECFEDCMHEAGMRRNRDEDYDDEDDMRNNYHMNRRRGRRMYRD